MSAQHAQNGKTMNFLKQSTLYYISNGIFLLFQLLTFPPKKFYNIAR